MDIEKFSGSGGDIEGNDPVMGILQALIVIRQEQNHTTEMVHKMSHEVDRMKATAAENTEWMTLRGFVRRYVTEYVDTSDPGLSRLGGKIKSWHEALGRDYRRRGGFHATYGAVNQYHVDNLFDYFSSCGMQMDEELFASDKEKFDR